MYAPVDDIRCMTALHVLIVCTGVWDVKCVSVCLCLGSLFLLSVLFILYVLYFHTTRMCNSTGFLKARVNWRERSTVHELYYFVLYIKK